MVRQWWGMVDSLPGNLMGNSLYLLNVRSRKAPQQEERRVEVPRTSREDAKGQGRRRVLKGLDKMHKNDTEEQAFEWNWSRMRGRMNVSRKEYRQDGNAGRKE